MKTPLDTIKRMVNESAERQDFSWREAKKVKDYFDGYQWQYQPKFFAEIQARGQPPQINNLVKKYAMAIVGHYQNLRNTVSIKGSQPNDTDNATLMNDVIQNIFRNNKMQTISRDIKLDLVLHGICVCMQMPRDTGETDMFGRAIYEIDIKRIDPQEIVLDPLSVNLDYSDARFIHRHKWVSKDGLIELFPDKKDDINKLQPGLSGLSINYFENYERNGFDVISGDIESTYSTYFLMHSIIREEEKTWEVYWVGDTILQQNEITYNDVIFPYRVHKLYNTNRPEYYGMFRDCIATQDAVNQSLIKKEWYTHQRTLILEKGAVDNVNKARESLDVAGMVVVEDDAINRIKIDSLSSEIDKLDNLINEQERRFQEMIGVNPAFLGVSPASDSGYKVEIQKLSTITTLVYTQNTIEEWYRLLAMDICNLVKQYYTAYQFIRVSDEELGQRWTAINQPKVELLGYNENDEPITRILFDKQIDPASGEPVKNDKGNYIYTPKKEEKTDISFDAKYDFIIDSTPYDNEQEQAMQFVDKIVNGMIGQYLMQTMPTEFLRLGLLSIKGNKVKNVNDIAQVVKDAIMKLQQQQNG